MIGERRQPVVHIAADVGDLARIFGNGLLLPAVGDGSQRGHQQRGRGDQHMLLHGLGVQVGLDLKRRVKSRFKRHEHHHQPRRAVKLAPVRLG